MRRVRTTLTTSPLTTYSHSWGRRAFASPYAPERRRDLNSVNQDDIEAFKRILSQEENKQVLDGVIGGKGTVNTEQEVLETMNIDWMKKFRGHSTVALFPKTTKHVAEILKYCNERKIGVVPQGGNTGLVGGSVAVHDEVILSTAKMNKIISFDEVSGVLVCQSGCILQGIDQFLETKGHIMPLDLGAKGSCQIGGNVSTNAGGIRYIRYGSLKGSVLGLEVVLPDGSVLDTLNGMRKDNTGYDLKQLFIGAEGTLGIVTGVSLLAPTRPKSINVALVAVSSFADVQNTFVRAKRDLGEILSAFEFFDEESFKLELEQLSHLRNPLASVYPFHVLLEISGSNEKHDNEKLNQFLESAMSDDIVKDGAIAQDRTQFKQIWALRESITEGLSRAGPVYKYDLSIPISRMYDLVEETRTRIGSRGRVLGYGHVGDSNLHLNVSVPKYSEEILGIIEPFVYEWTSKLGGSISAEHGLGLMKRNHLHFSKSPIAIKYMRSVKQLFDPNGIMNPYKVLPDQI